MDLKELLGEAYKEGMTIEEIETALQGISLQTDNSDELARLKAALTKSNSEAANYKKQLREKLSEEEQKAQKDAEERAELQSKYEKLLHETEVSKTKAKFLGLGYEEKLAEETAEALVSGEFDKVISNQQKHQQALEKTLKADFLKATPSPVSGNGEGIMTLAALKKMSPLERHEYAMKNPEEYKSLYDGGNE